MNENELHPTLRHCGNCAHCGFSQNKERVAQRTQEQCVFDLFGLLGAVRVAVGKFHLLADQPGRYGTTTQFHLRRHIKLDFAWTILLTLLSTLAGFVHPFKTVMHTTSGADTLTFDWLG